MAIVTTWQHRPVDVVIGVVLAMGFGALFSVGRRRSPAANAETGTVGVTI